MPENETLNIKMGENLTTRRNKPEDLVSGKGWKCQVPDLVAMAFWGPVGKRQEQDRSNPLTPEAPSPAHLRAEFSS